MTRFKELKNKSKFPKPGTGVKKFYPYQMLYEYGNRGQDGRQFSIYIPAGTTMVYMSLNSAYATELYISVYGRPKAGAIYRKWRTIDELVKCDRKTSFPHGGGEKLTALNDDGVTRGPLWVFFELGLGYPMAYSISYLVNTDHPEYSPESGQPFGLPGPNPTPDEPKDEPKEDPSPENTQPITNPFGGDWLDKRRDKVGSDEPSPEPEPKPEPKEKAKNIATVEGEDIILNLVDVRFQGQVLSHVTLRLKPDGWELVDYTA